MAAGQEEPADEPSPDEPIEKILITGEQQKLPLYVGDRATAAMKTDTPIIETPQSVSLIPRDRLVDLGALTLQDSLRYSAGVRADAYGLDSRGDYAIIRGTEFTSYQDGLRMMFGTNFNNVRPDVYALESVEIIRGPASVLYGQGTTGGLVNVNTKKPLAVPAHEIVAQAGSYHRYQIAADTTGPVPLVDDESLLYRIVGLFRDSDTQVDFVKDDRRLIAPSFTWMPLDWITWTIVGNYQQDRSGSSTAFLPWEGTILFNPNGQIPTRRFVSEPGFDRYDTNQWAVTSLLDLELWDGWSFSQNVRFVESGADYNSMFPNVYSGDPYALDPIERTSVQRLTFTSDIDLRTIVADHQLQVDWSVGPVENMTLGGVDVTRVRSTEVRGVGFDADLFDLYAPVYGDYTAPVGVVLPRERTKQTGVYFQDQARLGNLIGVFGIRYDDATTETEGNPSQDDGATSLRGGLLYHFDVGVAPYVSYTESFQPVIGLDAEDEPYQPIRGKQFETGVKLESEWVDWPGLVTVAYFDLEEKNRLAPGPTPVAQIQLGFAKIRGFEFEAFTTLFDTVDLIATYTYLDGYSDNGPESVPRIQNLVGVPDNSASGWATWRFDANELQDVVDVPGLFAVGGGIRFTGSIPDETNTVSVPAVTLYDAMLAWETDRWRIALNGSNLADEVVVAVCLSRGDCFYGPRRAILGTVAYRF